MGVVIDFLDYLANNPWLIIVLFLLYVFIYCLSLFFNRPKPGKNPFRVDMKRTPKDVVTDQNIRDRVLKQGFGGKKIAEDFDAIVVGSGIGGLGAAAILSKAGKKVLVLEQHDQAGGCCHTFVEKGFEFDVGIHYIGEMRNNTVGRLLVEQITEGQLCWEDLLDELDMVVLGEPGKQKFIPFVCAGGKDKWKAALLEKFPDEEKALDKFWSLLMDVRKNMLGQILLKTLPRRLCKFLIHTGLLNKTTKFFQYSKMSVQETLDGLTQNKDLKAVLAYAFGDYGSQPNNGSFAMHAALLSHYIYGGSYPKGGASEIAFHLIPVIEKEGGQVLVRAPVSQILCEKGKVVGVRVQRKSGDVDIRAPLVISDAGVINTFTRLLPKEVAEKSRMQQLIKKKVHSGIGAMQLFVGLNGTTEELGLKAQNYWVFTSNDLVRDFESFYSKSSDEASQCDIPLLFISFPSAKDSTFNIRYPGKSVATIVTLGNWDWFKKWETERVQKRGEEYEALKQAIGRRMWDQVLNIFPKLADKVEYFEVGTPLSNNYYLNSPKGEIYGLDHTRERFADPEIVMDLRPETDVPGLLLTGQDVLSCGFMGGLFGGVLCASKALNRNVYTDLLDLKKQIAKQE